MKVNHQLIDKIRLQVAYQLFQKLGGDYASIREFIADNIQLIDSETELKLAEFIRSQ